MIELDNRFPELGEWKSFEELENIHDRYIEDNLNHAYKLPFYKELISNYSNSLKLTDFPIITKEDLRRAYPFGMLAVPKEKLSSYHESSGTTGNPTSSYFTENDWNDIASRFNRNRVNLSEQDTVMIKTPYAMLTTAHQMHKAALLRKATIVPADNRSSITTYTRVIKLLRDIQISVAWCMPTEPLFWAKTAKLNGYDPKIDFPNLREFLVAGEALNPKKRERMESIWGNIKISQDYGSTETGSLAGECSHGNLHLWADRFIFEVYDADEGILKREGEGQLVVTSLFREAMPLIRYNLGDFVRVTYESCDCNWNLPKIEIIGRNSTPIIQHKKLFPNKLEELIYDLPEENEIYFWRGKYDKDRLIVELETSSDISDVSAKLKSDIMDHLQINAEVKVVPSGTLVPDEILLAQNQFAKPKFLFADNEDWSKAILY